MSRLIAKLPIAQYVDVGDFIVVVQGTPGITRRGTVAQLRAAWRSFSGQTSASDVTAGPKHISELPLANEIYTNDYMMLDQGTPAITRKVLVSNVLLASTNGPSNTELTDNNQDEPISGLPTGSTAYLNDYTLLNQGTPPVTRRTLLTHALGLS